MLSSVLIIFSNNDRCPMKKSKLTKNSNAIFGLSINFSKTSNAICRCSNDELTDYKIYRNI